METLNYIEAVAAVGAGKCVLGPGKDSDTHKFEDGQFFYWHGDWFETSTGIVFEPGNVYKIVPDPSLPAIPEKKSLSFDEARENVVDCKPMIIQEHAKEGVLYVTRKTWSVDPCMDLLMLDLADRRGLLVTEYKAPAHPIDKEG